MIKLYCLKIEHFESSFFSETMSSKYNEESSKRRSSFAWRSLEKIILNELGISLNKDMVIINKNGKPYLKDVPFYFSLSHSGEYAICVYSAEPVGADLQIKKKSLPKHTRKILSSDESTYLNSLGENKQMDVEQN